MRRSSVYAVNPCRQEWGEIASERKVATSRISPEPPALRGPSRAARLPRKTGARLHGDRLRAGGRRVRDDRPIRAPREDSLLHVLQSGILDLTEEHTRRGRTTVPSRSTAAIRRCGRCRSCSDRLLDLFDRDPSLKPSDVMVLAPDINEYAPYVDAVFAAHPDEAVRDPLRDRRQDPGAEGPGSGSVAGPAGSPALQVRGGHGGQPAPPRPDRGRVRHLAGRDRPGLGVGGAERHPMGDRRRPEEDPRAAGDDPLSPGPGASTGWCSASRSPDPQPGGPYSTACSPPTRWKGQEIELLDRFVRFATTLKEWTEDLGKPRTMAAVGRHPSAAGWTGSSPAAGRSRNSAKRSARPIEQCVAGSVRAPYGKPVEYAVIRKIMIGALGETARGCVQLRRTPLLFDEADARASVPRDLSARHFRRGVPPRALCVRAFDLMRRYFRHGDRSGRLDDRYLFLELLLSARDRFIVSYVGEDVRSGKNLPPSPVLGELLDFVGRIAFANPSMPRTEERRVERAEEPC